MSSIYQEHILDHYSHPRNRHEMKDPDVYYKDTNPLCGDEVAVYARLEKSGSQAIAEASFVARGCAISQAAASMLTEFVKGKNLKQVYAMAADDMLGMLRIPISHNRVKCAVLALKAMQAGIAFFMAKSGVSEKVSESGGEHIANSVSGNN